LAAKFMAPLVAVMIGWAADAMAGGRSGSAEGRPLMRGPALSYNVLAL
jgi:hypothetical protein